MHRARLASAAALAAFALALRALPAAAQDATVEVDTTADLGPVNRDVLGVDWEYNNQTTPEVTAQLAGAPLARFPGGDDTSTFLWTDTSTGTCAQPRWTWPAAAETASRLGVGFLLETNILRDTAQGAADWVADARGRGLRVPWVCIGNEVWGSWDAGYRSAAQYASDVRAHAAAIHARAPGTGVVLEIGTFSHDAWNREAVRRTADVIDAVDYHYYPNHLAQTDPLSVAAGADGVAPLLARLRAMLREEAPDRADHLGIILGEWDGAGDAPLPGPPVAGVAYEMWSVADALFYGAAIGEMLYGGVAAAMFYELQGYRFGAVGGNACLAADLRIVRPKALAMRLYREHFGDRLVSVTPRAMPTFHSAGPTNWDGFAGDAPVVKTYASLAGGGNSLRLVVVNRTTDRATDVRYELAGFRPEGQGQQWQLAGDSILAVNENVGGPIDAVHLTQGTLAVQGSSFTFHAPAHSVTAIELRRAQDATDAGTPSDAGTDASAQGDAASGDASAPDAGTSGGADAGRDGGAHGDAGVPNDAAPPSDNQPPVVSGGCSSGPASAGASLATALSVVLVALLARARHRRATRRGTAPRPTPRRGR